MKLFWYPTNEELAIFWNYLKYSNLCKFSKVSKSGIIDSYAVIFSFNPSFMLYNEYDNHKERSKSFHYPTARNKNLFSHKKGSSWLVFHILTTHLIEIKYLWYFLLGKIISIHLRAPTSEENGIYLVNSDT